MSRWWRRLTAALGLVLGLVFLLALLAGVLLPREEIATRVAERLAAATGAEVTPGTASLKLSGGLGLRLQGGRVRGDGRELGRCLGFESSLESYDIRFSRLDVTLAPVALLRRRLAVSQVTLAGPELAVRGEIGPVQLSGYEMKIDHLRLDLGALEQMSGTAPGERIPADLAFELRVGIDVLEINQGRWDEVRLQGRWARRELAVNDLTARLGAGKAHLTGVVDYNEYPWGGARWSLQLSAVPARQLLLPFAPAVASRLTCELTGEASGFLQLKNPAVRLKTLQAAGELNAGAGTLAASDWLAAARPYLGARQDLTTIHFTALSHRFTVRDGRYLLDEMRLSGPDTDWQATGWLGFDGDLGLRVGVRLPAGFTPDLGAMSFLAETLRDDEERVRLGLKLSGRMAAPRIGLDFGGLRGGH